MKALYGAQKEGYNRYNDSDVGFGETMKDIINNRQRREYNTQREVVRTFAAD